VHNMLKGCTDSNSRPDYPAVAAAAAADHLKVVEDRVRIEAHVCVHFQGLC
jgi:hypothetical protein